MEAIELISDSLNEQQLLMLRLLKNPLPESAFNQIRQLAVKLLASQIDAAVDDWEKQKDITGKNYETLSKLHFRSKIKKS